MIWRRGKLLEFYRGWPEKGFLYELWCHRKSGQKPCNMFHALGWWGWESGKKEILHILSRVKDRFRVNPWNQVWTVQRIGLPPVKVLTPEDYINCIHPWRLPQNMGVPLKNFMKMKAPRRIPCFRGGGGGGGGGGWGGGLKLVAHYMPSIHLNQGLH